MPREQCERLHNASLEILERTGVRLYLQEAVDLLRTAGCQVTEGNRVYIPAGLVEKALTTVPKRITLYDRHGKPALYLEPGRCYYGPGSDCLHIIDHRTGQRRDPVLQDVVEGVRLCDALPYIGFVMSLVLPADVDSMVSDRYQMEAMLNNTTKPIVMVTNEFAGCVDGIEMAEIVAGGAEALSRRPFVAVYINVTTGLRHNEEALQKLLFLAERNIPSLYIPVCIGGLTAPMSVPAGMALTNAGALVGVVLSQLKREGAPVILPGWGGASLDMRTTVSPYSWPDSRSMAHAMANFYGIPMFGMGGCSESKVVDQQAAAEAALTMMAETLGGAQLIHDLGYLESGLAFSPAQLVICHELAGWIAKYFSPARVDDDTLLLDEIDEVGPDGQFLDHPHTLAHFRDFWYPDIFDRADYFNWERAGGTTAAERAAQRVQDILTEHESEPLLDDVREAVHAVVQKAEKDTHTSH